METPERCERKDCGVPNDVATRAYKTGDGLTVEITTCWVCQREWKTYVEKPKSDAVG